MAIISLFQTIHNRKHVRQILAYPDSAVHFRPDFLSKVITGDESWGFCL